MISYPSFKSPVSSVLLPFFLLQLQQTTNLTINTARAVFDYQLLSMYIHLRCAIQTVCNERILLDMMKLFKRYLHQDYWRSIHDEIELYRIFVWCFVDRECFVVIFHHLKLIVSPKISLCVLLSMKVCGQKLIENPVDDVLLLHCASTKLLNQTRLKPQAYRVVCQNEPLLYE